MTTQLPEGAKPKLFAALVKAQLAARAVEKKAENQHHRYKYASAESMIEEGRTSLAANGLALIGTNVTLVPSQYPECPATLRILYVLAHDSGESIAFEREWPALLQRGRPLDKAEGGALTTALAYAIRDVLLLPRDDELAAMDRRDDTSYQPGQQQPYYTQQQQGNPAAAAYMHLNGGAPEQDNFPPSYGEPQQAPQQQGAPMPGASPQNDNPTTRRLWGLILDAQSTQLIEAAVAQAMHELGGQSPAFQELRTYAKAKFEHLASIEDSAPPDNGPNPLDVADAAE